MALPPTGTRGQPSGITVPIFGNYNGASLPTSYGFGSSFVGGGTIGYNWQRPGSYSVLGIEGEVGYLHLTGSLQDVNATAARLSSIDSVDLSHLGDWYGVIAGRAGWSADRALFYLKGGAAFINHNYSFADNCIGGGAPGCGPGFLVINRCTYTQFTYAVGAGIEYAFNNNCSVKGEYLYLGSRKSYASSGTSVAAPAGVLFTNTNSDPNINIGKIVSTTVGGPHRRAILRIFAPVGDGKTAPGRSFCFAPASAAKINIPSSARKKFNQISQDSSMSSPERM